MKLVAWISSSLAALDRVRRAHIPPASGANPAVIVHGIFSTSRDMARLAQHLRLEGREVFTPDLAPAGGQIGVDELAEQLARFVELHLRGRRFDLIGFSMGGLVSRYFLQRLGGLEHVDHFVSIATPHRGTITAQLNLSPGGRQMRRESKLLRELACDAESLSRVKFTSIYTPLDLMVLPARSSAMPQARNLRIWAVLHPSLILEKRCLRAIAEALSE